jgi:hypothetical protein
VRSRDLAVIRTCAVTAEVMCTRTRCYTLCAKCCLQHDWMFMPQIDTNIGGCEYRVLLLCMQTHAALMEQNLR